MISKEQTERTRAYFAKQSEIIAIYLYGSCARGTNNALSDIDIAVMVDRLDEQVSRQHLDFIGKMMEIFQTDNVDVQLLTSQTPPTLARDMIRGIVIYCHDDKKRVAVEAEILSRYQDFEPFLSYQIMSMERRLQKGTYAHRYSSS